MFTNRIRASFHTKLLPPTGICVSLHGSLVYLSDIEPFCSPSWSNWEELPIEIIEKNFDALSFFSDSAFQYYLPAFMIAALNLPEDSPVIDYTRRAIFLSCPVGDIAVDSMPRFSGFTPSQLQVTNQFANLIDIFLGVSK